MKKEILVYECVCENPNCNWHWISRIKEQLPHRCPKCKNKKWNKSNHALQENSVQGEKINLNTENNQNR